MIVKDVYFALQIHEEGIAAEDDFLIIILYGKISTKIIFQSLKKKQCKNNEDI